MRHAALATGAALVVGWPWAAPRYFVFLASLIAINAIVAIGLNLLSGYTNQLSFGHAGFLAIGAYSAAILTIRAPALPVPVTLLIAGLVTAAVGLALGVPCLRLDGLYLAMATLAFGFVVVEAILSLDWLTRGNDGLRVPAARLGPWMLATDTARYYLVMAVAALLIVAAVNISRTRTGRALLAVRESEIAAQASGIHLAAYKTMAFVVSAFYTGVAGGLFALRRRLPLARFLRRLPVGGLRRDDHRRRPRLDPGLRGGRRRHHDPQRLARRLSELPAADLRRDPDNVHAVHARRHRERAR